MVDFLSSPLSNHLFLTLVHFLWQGFLVGFVYCLVMANISAKSVEFRYGISLLALLGMALFPVGTFAMLRQSPSAAASIAVSATAPAADLPTAPIIEQRRAAAPARAERNGREIFDIKEQASSHPVMGFGPRTLAAVQPYGLLIWWAGVLICGARLSAGIFGLFWIRSDRRRLPDQLQRYSETVARRLGVRSAKVFASSRTSVACVAGLLKPVVLLPTSWLSQLPPDVLEAVIAHELAHIRRFDTWINLLQRVLETLLFYHPMVWWLSNRVRYERELCCDKLAVDATGDRRIYIRALEQVGRLQVHGSLSLTPAFTGDRKMNLLTRVQHILCMPRRDREPSWVVGLAVMLSALAVGLTTGIITDAPAAFAQQREGDPSAEAEAERRFSPEAERGERRSPEAERDERRSPEAERGERRSPEAERGDRRSRESDDRRERRDPLDRFEPQSDREAALFRMIVELRREVAELRREVGQAKYRREGDQPQRYRAEQDRDRPGDKGRADYGDRDRPRFGDEGPRDRPQLDPAHRKLQKIFLSRDKNRDQKLNRDEFNSLFEGGPRNDVFDAADRNDDDGLSFDEFVEHRFGQQAGREGERDR